jgi:hypothetical protein
VRKAGRALAGPAGELDHDGCLRVDAEPRTTIGFGHIVDLAVGPTRGPIVSLPGSAAEAFLTSIDALDESRSIAEGLPPRHGVAIFVRREQGDAALAERPAEILGLEWAIGSR